MSIWEGGSSTSIGENENDCRSISVDNTDDDGCGMFNNVGSVGSTYDDGGGMFNNVGGMGINRGPFFET